MTLNLSNPGDAVIGDILSRAGSAGYEEWWAKVADSGFCAAPIRLEGETSHRQTEIFARCKNRRASVCPSCSQLYAGDTWQLVHAGIVGEDERTLLDGRPMVFVTLTAPSFGSVHAGPGTASGARGLCRPGRQGLSCRHGRPSGCAVAHEIGDAVVGEPLCPDCYDYLGHVLFTWHAPALWHRFTVVLRRLVARQCRESAGDGAVKVAYVKVVELQRRAVPHFHTVIRLDDLTAVEGAVASPRIGPGQLGALVLQAGTLAALPVRTRRRTMTSRFGEQLDVRALDDASGRRVAAYLAKYVTKSVGDFGLTARRLHEGVVGELDVSDHVRRILQTIAKLAREPDYSELGMWLHTLGYRGHITTKTRGYSTTMGELRARRDAWRREQRRPDADGDDVIADPAETEWRYKGCGHATEGERYLAISAAGREREMRRAAREALTRGTADD